MKRRCASCGEVLAKGANFCRACGAPAAAPELPGQQAPRSEAGGHPMSAPAADPGTPRRSRTAIVASLAILAIGAGAAAAILLGTGGGSSSTTTVLQDAATAPSHGTRISSETGTEAAGSIETGRYIQAGSFQTEEHAEAERRRLSEHGIEVAVVPSDGARELYPGFQVLLGGPLHSGAAEASMLRGLHRNGVPSAFAKDLTAAETDGPIAGRWAGEVERTSGEDPRLDGSLPVSVAISSDGTTGSLDLSTLGCHSSLSLTSTASGVFTYTQEPACIAAETLYARVLGSELMLSLLSPRTDAFTLGTLERG
jgi:hypothetical protein